MNNKMRKPRMKVEGNVILKEYSVKRKLRSSLEAELLNISPSGMGIKTERKLQIGHYFHAELSFDSEKPDFNLMKVVRIEEREDSYLYGCQFIELVSDSMNAEEIKKRAI